jgi:hypothetical protein
MIIFLFLSSYKMTIEISSFSSSNTTFLHRFWSYAPDYFKFFYLWQVSWNCSVLAALNHALTYLSMAIEI